MSQLIGQGSYSGALVSQVKLDFGVDDMFAGSQDELGYGRVRGRSYIFQDDILRLCGNLSSVRAGNVKMDILMSIKLLKFNCDKTVFILLGRRSS